MSEFEGQLVKIVQEHGLESHELLPMLTQKIKFLLEKDFKQLVQVLYRLDISEVKVKEAFSKDPDSDAIAYAIASLIIEKEKQKQAFRLKYKNW